MSVKSVVTKSIAQSAPKLTPLTVIRELRQHFYRATVAFDYKFKEVTKEEYEEWEKECTNIDKEMPFKSFIFEELPQSTPEKADFVLQPTFEDFCKDGSNWIQKDSVSDAKKKRFVNAIEDYLALRRACREEAHILLLNRVGVERDEKKLKEAAARYVGLAMPKEYNHQ